MTVASAAETPSSLRVLVVDDDEGDRVIVRRSLRSTGITTRCVDATNGEEAVRAMRAERFDCVFLDYHLPGTDGLRLLYELKRLGPDTPVVMLTGQGDEQVAVELMKAGATDYLNKGVLTPERLAHSMRYAVELSRAALATRRAQEELRVAADRLRFLADASRVLGRSLEVGPTLQTVAELSVPELGDFCFVYLDEPDGLRCAASAHADPGKSLLAQEFAQRHFLRRDHASSAVAAALRTLTTQQLAPMTDLHLAAVSGSDADLALLRALAPGSAIVIPMIARSAVRGAMIFGRSAAAPHDDAEISLAEDLVQRAAIAVDNARLFSLATEARDSAQASARRTAHLQELTAALAGAETVDEVGALVMQHGVRSTGAYAGVVACRTDDEIAIEVCTGYPESACMHQGRRWSVDANLPLAEAFRGDAIVLVPDAAAYPLGSGNAPRRAILWTFDAPREFSANDRAFMSAIAQQCAQAFERISLRNAERLARLEAEEANRAKSDFLARMSHDLRTPLNAIGGYAQLIELGVHGAVSPAQSVAIGRIRRAQEHLLTLINDILSYAKLEAGYVDLMLEPVRMDSVIEELGSLVRADAAGRGLALSLDAAGDALCVHADRARLIQILLNLVSNALKFTDAGAVHVRASAISGAVAIEVEDSGRGIPPERLEHIFDPFVQLRGVADEQKGGVGLGLAISRELARRMGGDVEVESVVGVGSTFRLRLPLAAVADAVPVLH